MREDLGLDHYPFKDHGMWCATCNWYSVQYGSEPELAAILREDEEFGRQELDS